jgi:ABC-type transport system involved in cytochrome c biogenesis permease component
MRTLLVALLGEVRKGLLISWTYKGNQLISLLTLGFIFYIIVFFMSGGKPDPEQIASALLGYLVWMYVASALGDLTYGLRGEINAGTLEQLSMSQAPVWFC